MKYCHNCGKQIDDGAIFCSGCGARQDGTINNNAYGGFSYGGYYGAPPYREERTFGYAVLAFFFPIVGFILWILWRDTRPVASKSALKGALIGVAVNIVMTVLGSIALYSISGMEGFEEMYGMSAFIFNNRLLF